MSKVFIYSHRWKENVTSHELTIRCLEDYLQLTAYPLTEAFPGEEFDHRQILADKPSGKPYFKDYPGIFHNVSHSGDWWVCALGTEENGLDLQQVVPKDTGRIARRFFHPHETAWLSDRPPEQFFRMWAYKESYVKFIGDGLTRGIAYFSTLGSHNDILSDHEEQLPGVENVCQQEIPFSEQGYWLVLTTREPVEIILKNI